MALARPILTRATRFPLPKTGRSSFRVERLSRGSTRVLPLANRGGFSMRWLTAITKAHMLPCCRGVSPVARFLTWPFYRRQIRQGDGWSHLASPIRARNDLMSGIWVSCPVRAAPPVAVDDWDLMGVRDSVGNLNSSCTFSIAMFARSCWLGGGRGIVLR